MFIPFTKARLFTRWSCDPRQTRLHYVDLYPNYTALCFSLYPDEIVVYSIVDETLQQGQGPNNNAPNMTTGGDANNG